MKLLRLIKSFFKGLWFSVSGQDICHGCKNTEWHCSCPTLC